MFSCPRIIGALVGVVSLGMGSAAPARDAEKSPPLAWAAGPLEVRIAFQQPISLEEAQALVGREIAFHEGASRPGSPPRVPLGKLTIAGVTRLDRDRTLVLATDPHPRRAHYLLELPRRLAPAQPERGLQAGQLEYGIEGFEASWFAEDAADAASWTGTWPELDTHALRAASALSADHRRALELLTRRGQLTLRAWFVPPRGTGLDLVLRGSASFEVVLGDLSAGSRIDDRGDHVADLAFVSAGEPAELNLILETGSKGAPEFRATLRTDGDAVGRRVPPDWFLPTWAPPAATPTPNPSPPPFALEGGQADRGAEVFFSKAARCGECHRIGRRGGEVGPPLDGQKGRPLPDIYQDIADPSGVIHPEYVTYTVALDDGQVAVGVVRAEGIDHIRVMDTNARMTRFPKARISQFSTSGASVMPVGLAGALGEQSVRDLVAFLRRGPAGPAAPGPPDPR